MSKTNRAMIWLAICAAIGSGSILVIHGDWGLGIPILVWSGALAGREIG